MSEKVRSVLVVGGARSGKSIYAQSLAERSGRELILIAAAQAGDAEMAERIARHRAERGAGWQTIEEPMKLLEALRAAADPARVIVVDCLTLWLTNLMLAEADVETESRELARTIPALRGPVIFVSNEVGQGVVPATELGRRFRDAQGRLNQAVVAVCGHVVLMNAGLPLQIKPARAPDIAL